MSDGCNCFTPNFTAVVCLNFRYFERTKGTELWLNYLCEISIIMYLVYGTTNSSPFIFRAKIFFGDRFELGLLRRFVIFIESENITVLHRQ